MWSYKIASGVMSQNGQPWPVPCYSGIGEGKNNPAFCKVKDVGPIPPGKYKFSTAIHDPEKGPLSMLLVPLPGTDTFGRNGFMIHGDSIEHPGSASHGCIVAPAGLRMAMNASQDRVLEVIA